jgi:N-acetylmuramoyl-L-alanine amidase
LSRATGAWTLAQDYGPSDSYTWTPTGSEQGTYAIQAWVRRSGSTANYEAVLGTLDFQIGNASPVIVTLSSDYGPPVAAGAPVTWTADASGGPGPLQYSYSLYSVERESWSLVKPYSSSNTFTWRPGPWDMGSYVLRVDVRRSGSTASEATTTTGTFSITNNTVPTIVSVARSTASLRVGAPIVWTAKATGGSPGLEYSFARYNTATQQWTVVQAYSWDSSYAWTPLAGDEGTYNLQVYVRRAGTTVAYEHTMPSGNFTITN